MPVTYDAQYNIDAHWMSAFAAYSGVRRYDNGVLSAELRTSSTLNYFSNSAVVNDYLAFGVPTPWKKMIFRVGTARNGTVTIAWEYYNGSTWLAIPGGAITDNTAGFTVLGINTIVLDPTQMPGWVTGVPSGFSGNSFYIRGRITSVSGLTLGGAQVTDKLKFYSDCVVVDGYTGGSPCTLALIKSANDAGGWGVVTAEGTTAYTIRAHLHFGTTGYLTEVNKTLVIGTSQYGTVMSADAGPTIQFGSLDAGGLGYRAKYGCHIRMNNPYTIAYPTFNASMIFYASTIYSVNSHSTTFQTGTLTMVDTNWEVNNGLIYGPSVLRRVNILNAPYIATPVTAVYDDVYVSAQIALDHGNYPEFGGCKFDYNGSWLTVWMSASGNRQCSVFGTNCYWFNFASVNLNNNADGRFQVVDAVTYDLTVTDASSAAISGASIYLYNANTTQLWADSTATIASLTDSVTWGDTAIITSNGAVFTIGDKILVEGEIMTVTNIVTNTLTCTRAVASTYIARHQVGKKIRKQIMFATTDGNGAAPQQLLMYRTLFQFGVNTPAPYNDATLHTIVANSYTLRLRKYGYVESETAFTVIGKTVASTALPLDAVIQQPLVATVAAYTGISINHATQTIAVTSAHTVRELYDYCAYNAALTANIKYSKFFTSTDGINFSCLYDLTVTATTLSGTGNINMDTKTLTLASGGVCEPVVTDITGTTVRLSIVLPHAGMAVDVHDGSGVQFAYEASVTGTYDIIIPTGSTGTWSFVINKQGYVYGTGTFVPGPGGVFAYSPACPQVFTPEGVPMYQGTTSALVTVSGNGTNTYIDIGNGTPTLQAIYDEYEDFLTTAVGMDWITNGNDGISIFNSAGGDYLFMTSMVRLRRALVGDVNATVPAFAQSVDGTPVDEVNGTVRYLTSDSPTAIAAAVMAYVVETGKTMHDMQRLMSAVLLGKSSGSPANPVFRDVNDTKDRVWGAVDTNGNRTAVVTDAT